MREYVSHKRVKAAEIVNVIEVAPDGSATLELKHPAQTVNTKPGLCARGTPSPGDYLVEYSDGYQSWSPKKAFEEGYTPVEDLSRAIADKLLGGRR